MSAANKSVENATLQADASSAQSTADSNTPAKPRRRWPFVALIVGLLVFGCQIYLQSDYWGQVLNQGTIFPNMQRAIFMRRRESEEPRRHEALPIPGSPDSLAGTVPPPEPKPQNVDGTADFPTIGDVKAKP